MRVIFIWLLSTLAIVLSQPGIKDGHQPPPYIVSSKFQVVEKYIGIYTLKIL